MESKTEPTAEDRRNLDHLAKAFRQRAKLRDQLREIEPTANLALLEFFYFRGGTVTEAARLLGLTHQGVSYRLKRLRERYQIPVDIPRDVTGRAELRELMRANGVPRLFPRLSDDEVIALLGTAPTDSFRESRRADIAESLAVLDANIPALVKALSGAYSAATMAAATGVSEHTIGRLKGWNT